jgi:hypothetical protein
LIIDKDQLKRRLLFSGTHTVQAAPGLFAAPIRGHDHIDSAAVITRSGGL